MMERCKTLGNKWVFLKPRRWTQCSTLPIQECPDGVCVFSNSALLLNSVMRAFRPEFVAARATDFISMIKDCDEAGFPKVRHQEPAVWFPASMKLDVRNACCCRDVSSTSCLVLWDAVLPAPTLLRQRGWAFWTKRGRWSPKCAVLRCSRNTAIIMEMFVIGSRCLTWGLLCFYFRITSTVLKSGWSSHADTSQWESWIIKNRGAVTCFSDLNHSFSTRNVRSIPSWLTSSNTWPLTERLRMLILRLAVHLLTLCSFKAEPCRPHTVFGFTAAVSHQEDPRILPQLFCPLLYSGSLPASHDKMYFPLKGWFQKKSSVSFFSDYLSP